MRISLVKLVFFFFVFSISLCDIAYAKNFDFDYHLTHASTNLESKQDSLEFGNYEWRDVSLNLSGGTLGAGIEVRYRLNEKWAIGGRFSYLPLSYHTQMNVSGYLVDMQINGLMSYVGILGYYSPFKRSYFRLVGGISYLNKEEVSSKIVPVGSYRFGMISLNGSDIGVINSKMYWHGIVPYLGMVIGNPKPKRAVSLNLGVGVYYISKPNVSISGTNFLSGNNQNEESLDAALDDYRFYPDISVQLLYKFKKKIK